MSDRDGSDDASRHEDLSGAAQSYAPFAATAPGLFPAYAATSSQPGPSWLQNSSFTAVNASAMPPSAAAADEARREQSPPSSQIVTLRLVPAKRAT